MEALPIVAGGIFSWLDNDSKNDAVNNAAGSQQGYLNKGVDELRNRFSSIRDILQPYLDVGPQALGYQKDIAGLNGPEKEQAFINSITNSPQFQSLFNQGENAILQNASATGGLRGGNTQEALAKFRPSLLNELIENRYSKLSGLTSLGRGAANELNTSGLSTSGGIAGLLGNIGQSEAGRYQSIGENDSNFLGSLGGMTGNLLGLMPKPKLF